MWPNVLRLVVPFLLVLPLASCSGKKATNNPALLGTWEGKANNKTFSLTFEQDGHVTLGGDIQALGSVLTSMTLLTDFGIQPGKNMPITYSCPSENKLEVEGDFTALLEKLSAGGTGVPSPEMKEKLHPRETLTFSLAGKELTLTNAKGKSTTLRRTE